MLIYKRFRCEIYRVDIYLVCSDESVLEAEKTLRKRAGFGYDGITDEWAGGYIQNGSNFAMLLTPGKNFLRNIHHETTHIAMSIFNRVGMTHSVETDEAFCYLSDWIFWQVTEELKKNKVQI